MRLAAKAKAERARWIPGDVIAAARPKSIRAASADGRSSR
jgi:hypothetical protein